MSLADKSARRRLPTQRRARQTVEAVLDAVTRVLRRQGLKGLTTNKIAAAAGVSVGSLYQYFPDKRAILVAVRDRHVDQMSRLIEDRLIECANAPLAQLVRELLDAMVEAHAADPALYELLLTQLPQEASGQTVQPRWHAALRAALALRIDEIDGSPDLDRVLFVLTHMLESLAHKVVLDRPPSVTLEEATDEAARAVLGYIQTHG